MSVNSPHLLCIGNWRVGGHSEAIQPELISSDSQYRWSGHYIGEPTRQWHYSLRLKEAFYKSSGAKIRFKKVGLCVAA